MDLKTLSIDQLKVKIYDSLVVVENHNQFIKLLNTELQSRATQPVQEVVNQIIKEDENKQEN